MKLPKSKRKQIEKKGGSMPEKGEGGGARAREQQFRKQRGLKQARAARSGVGRASPRANDESSDRKC